VVWFGKRLVVPVDPEIKKIILDEAHRSKFSIHSGSTKMYQDLKQKFWWSNMKVDVAKYVAECDTCHRMKASHLKSAGVLQPLSIRMWKWDDICMDFIVGLPLTARKKDSIWVIVDRLTKNRSLHCRAHHLLRTTICRVVCGPYSSSAWNPKDYNL
jgi:hypothetical protein